MSENKIPEEDFKKLYNAIANAIFNSEEIKPIVQDLKERNKINSMSVFALFIRLNELTANLSLPAKASIQRKEGKNLRDIEKGQFIDGEMLTKNEIAFEEFCRENFDEEKWLEENKIKY